MSRRRGAMVERPWWDSHYGRMLLEDVRHNVMPIGGRTRYAAAFLVGLSTGSNASAKAVVEAISGRSRFQARDLAGVVCDWVADCAVATLQNGQADYAVSAVGKTASIKRRRMGELTAVHGVDVLGIRTSRLPRKYGDAFAEMCTAVGVLSDPRVTGKLLGYFEPGDERVPFEFDLFRQEEARATARATAFIGWNARNSFHPEHGQNAYHFVYRELRFHAFKAMLRERALICLNESLQLAGEALGQSMRVEVTGLRSEEDAEKALSELELGHTSFSDLLDPFRL